MKRMDSSSSLISTSVSTSNSTSTPTPILTSITTLIPPEIIKNECVPQNECSNEALPSVTTATEVSSFVLQQMQPIEEMLGSVTTYNNLEGPDASGNTKNCQQVRSSARVFKKMKLENAQALTIIPSVDKDKKDTSDKIEVKRSFRPQWSPEDKDAFFEALNEYGKDFDAIQQHIINKFKKKSLPESLKTKEQIRHFYYRTWQKISKHLKFSEDIKKIAQELYALINFGEFRKKVGSVSEKTCLKLNELIYRGTVAIRIKGKTIRIKTPMCRALRKLNQLDEKHEDLKLPTRVLVELRPKNVETWINVQFMSQNPRVRVSLPLQRRLSALLQCLNDRWKSQQTRTHEKVHSYTTSVLNENQPCTSSSNGIALSPQLRLAPKSNCSVAMPAINLSEYLTSHRICLNAYEERIGVKVPGEKLWQTMFIGFRNVGRAKNRGIKRQRNDSAGDKNPKIKENCDEQDSDTPMTVSDVVDSAINTILSLQKQESDIDSDAAPCAPLSTPTTPQKEEIKIEPTTEPPAPFVPCRKEEISKIKNGWTLDDCGSLTVGEMYLMFGHDSKLELEYSWDALELKPEPFDTEMLNGEVSDREINDIKEAPPSQQMPPSNELSVTLKKLLSLAKLHYRKERIKCPCGHVCGGPKATTANRTKSMVMKTNQRATTDNATTTTTAATTAAAVTAATMTATTAATTTQETVIRSLAPIMRAPQINRKVNINPEPTFRTPTLYPSNGAPTDTFRAQLDSLQRMRPKYTNRKGRPVRSKHVVVERMLPLLPKPLINGHSIVAMKVISQTDQLRPIAPRIDESPTSSTSNTNNNKTIDKELKTMTNSDGVTTNGNSSSNNNKFETTASFFKSSSEATSTPQLQEDDQAQRVTCTSPTSISNFLDLDIPTADTNDLILQHSVAGAKENLTSFAGLLSDEMPDTTTPMSSPSRILKENDNQWLNSEVHDYSLTSLLGHLESPMKTTTPAIIPCDDAPISQDIDAQFPSLLGENGVDFVDQFVDMAAQVDTVNSEIEQ